MGPQSWTKRHQTALVKAFFADPLGKPFDDPEHCDWVDTLLDYRSGYGFGDPQRWSPASVEMLLMDWVPRKLVADKSYLLKLPSLLTALITFVHRRSGVAAPIAGLALEALEELTPEYVAAISTPAARRDPLLAWATKHLGVFDGHWPGSMTPRSRTIRSTPTTCRVTSFPGSWAS